MNTPTEKTPSYLPDIAPEHPFAEYVRILGKGKTGTRSLTGEEAEAAMGMILRNEVEDIQLGAFMMLLRVKEESPEELLGFVKAVRNEIPSPTFTVDLDWASYAGKRRQLPWYLLAALALADSGTKVFMHGAGGHTIGRLYSEHALRYMGETIAENWQQAEQSIADNNFVFMPLTSFSPVLQRIVDFRNHFGLRSPVHTLARLINPCNADYSLQSIFHPAYGESHQLAANQLAQKHAAVFKGEAGEVERKPEARTVVRYVNDGELSEETWPALLNGRQEKLESLNLDICIEHWQGKQQNEYGEQAVLGTLAIALKMMGKAHTQQQAFELAKDVWQARDRQRLG